MGTTSKKSLSSCTTKHLRMISRSPHLRLNWPSNDIAADPESLQYDHFKELGRFISVDLKEDKVKCELRKRFLDDMEKVEGSGVNGLCKLFLYEHFIVPRLSWAFLVHDFCLSFATELEAKA